MNRDRALLDLAHGLHDCTNCGRYVVEGLEPAHENSIEAGKGFGIKGQDHRHAGLCHDCHAWLDQGKGVDPSGCYDGTKPDKCDMWNRAHKRTFDLYWQLGWIQVTRR